MIRTIDEILEKSEENRITRELDECITEMLQLHARKVEELSPEELEKRQQEWDVMLAAAKAKATCKPKCIDTPPLEFKFGSIQPSKKNLLFGEDPLFSKKNSS